MAHAPWLDHLMARTPSAAKDAANVAATAVSPSAVGAPDAVSAAQDRMDARVYAQVPTASARTAASGDGGGGPGARARGRVAAASPGVDAACAPGRCVGLALVRR